MCGTERILETKGRICILEASIELKPCFFFSFSAKDGNHIMEELIDVKYSDKNLTWGTIFGWPFTKITRVDICAGNPDLDTQVYRL